MQPVAYMACALKTVISLTSCAVHLNGNRGVTGVLRGFDQFMNLVLDTTVDTKTKADIGMVVRPSPTPCSDTFLLHSFISMEGTWPVLIARDAAMRELQARLHMRVDSV